MTAGGQGPHEGGLRTPRRAVQENSLGLGQAHPNKLTSVFQRPFDALSIQKEIVILV